MGLILILALSAFGQSEEEMGIKGNRGNQMAGIRIGVHHFTADKTNQFEDGFEVLAESDASFVAEFYYNYFLLNQLGMELSLASAHRSDLVYTNAAEDIRLFGSANVYPISLGVKFTPLSGLVSDHYQPFLSIGGSLVVTRQLFDTSYYSYYYDYATSSETDLGWYWGVGFESYVSRTVCVTSSFKNYSIEYSDPIAGYKDHSGWQITVGAAYIMRSL